jgi:hypothetical protein
MSAARRSPAPRRGKDRRARMLPAAAHTSLAARADSLTGTAR